MNWSFYALVLGFCIDLLLGDPHGFPHPVVLIGKLIDALGRLFRALLPKTKSGEIAAGALLWVFTAAVSTAIPALLLIFAQKFPSGCGWRLRASCVGRFSLRNLCATRA